MFYFFGFMRLVCERGGAVRCGPLSPYLDLAGRKDLPKIKTSKGAAKRFKMTGTGKIVRQKSHLRHILTKKSRGRKRNLRKGALVSPADAGRVKRMIA